MPYYLTQLRMQAGLNPEHPSAIGYEPISLIIAS